MRLPNPNGMRNVARIAATPIKPSGAVSSTITIFLMSCSCIINTSNTMTSSKGITAKIERCAVALDSCEPPTSMA